MTFYKKDFRQFLKEKNFSAVNNFTTRYIYFQIRSPVSYLFILRLVVWPFFHGKRPFHGDFNFGEGRRIQEKNLKHCCSLQAAFRTDYTTDESEGRSKILLLSEASFCESITSVWGEISTTCCIYRGRFFVVLVYY